MDKQKRLFLNWTSILACHEDILKQMMSYYETSVLDLAQQIGSIFVGSKMKSFYQLYSFYINNFGRAQAELASIKHSSSGFSKFVAEIEEKLAAEKIAGSGLTLEGFLIMPVQRIPRYLMLIESLIKFTSPHDLGYDDLVRANTQFQSIATLINESKRKAEKLEEAKRVCLGIHGFPAEILLSTSGVSLLKSGELFQRKKSQKEDLRFFVLLLPSWFILAVTSRKKTKILITLNTSTNSVKLFL
jgi:hypothetical protein